MKILLFILLALFHLPVSAEAHSIGDVVGEAVYSDIAAYINHYPVKSYAIDGRTVVVAEDLADYGCDVIWNESERTLSITKSVEEKTITAKKIFKNAYPTGTKFADLLYTDIVVYINGNKVDSYAINGYTMITIEDFGACMDGFNWCPDIRAAKAWIDDVDCGEYKPLQQRVTKVFTDGEYSSHHHSGEFDFNEDGIEDSYSINVSYDGNEMTVSVNNSYKTVDLFEGGIQEVYLYNADKTSDWSIAVIVMQGSDDPSIFLFTYIDGMLKQEEFWLYGYNDRYEQWDSNGLGYVDDFYFNVNDNDTITIREMTSSWGMWDVYKTYARNGAGLYIELKLDYWEVIPLIYYDYLGYYGKERSMFDKGFLKAGKYFSDGYFTIKSGEYFKILYDNGDNLIYILKEDGTGAWIDIYKNSWTYRNTFEGLHYIFMLAG